VSQVKRVMISLPDTLLAEVDGIAAAEQLNRSEFIREAMKLYIAERKRRLLREQMKRGYLEMARINLAKERGINIPSTRKKQTMQPL
jgi:CopG family transcriptional regulator/antitoxin EndoAI